jgi:hypothetical protein
VVVDRRRHQVIIANEHFLEFNLFFPGGLIFFSKSSMVSACCLLSFLLSMDAVISMLFGFFYKREMRLAKRRERER